MQVKNGVIFYKEEILFNFICILDPKLLIGCVIKFVFRQRNNISGIKYLYRVQTFQATSFPLNTF